MNNLSRLFVVLAFAAAMASPALAAQPSPHDIQTAIQEGHFAQADREIAQVLAARPDSAKAHYVDARLLADEGKWPLAQAELHRAERLDPGMGFVRPDALQAFSSQVQDNVQAGPLKSSSSGLIVLATAFILIFLYIMVGIFRAQKRSSIMMPPGAMPMGAPGYPPAGTSVPAAGGSGLVGALGTGLAAGAGFAAGEALVDKLLERGQGSSDPLPSAGPSPLDTIPGDQDFGLADPNDWADGSNDTGSDDSWSDS